MVQKEATTMAHTLAQVCMRAELGLASIDSAMNPKNSVAISFYRKYLKTQSIGGFGEGVDHFYPVTD